MSMGYRSVPWTCTEEVAEQQDMVPSSMASSSNGFLFGRLLVSPPPPFLRAREVMLPRSEDAAVDGPEA